MENKYGDEISGETIERIDKDIKNIIDLNTNTIIRIDKAISNLNMRIDNLISWIFDYANFPTEDKKKGLKQI